MIPLADAPTRVIPQLASRRSSGRRCRRCQHAFFLEQQRARVRLHRPAGLPGRCGGKVFPGQVGQKRRRSSHSPASPPGADNSRKALERHTIKLHRSAHRRRACLSVRNRWPPRRRSAECRGPSQSRTRAFSPRTRARRPLDKGSITKPAIRCGFRRGPFQLANGGMLENPGGRQACRVGTLRS